MLTPPIIPGLRVPAHAALWTRPAVVAAAVVVAAVAGAIGYAGPGAAASVLYCLLVDGGVVTAWLAAAAGYGAAPVLLLCPRHPRTVAGDGADPAGGRPSLLTLVSAVALGLGVIGLLVLGLGLAGRLNQVGAVGLLALGGVANVAWLRRGRQALSSLGRRQAAGTRADVDRTDDDGADTADITPIGHPAWRWLWLLAAPPLAAALAAAMLPPGLLWKPEEPHGFDAVAYHLQVPREWFEAGRVVPLHHNVFSYFPFGVEVHYLLAMHLKGGPWDGMYLAQLMHLAMMALSVAAVYAVAARLAADRRIAIVASVAFATVPFLAQLGPLAFNEGGLLLYGTLSVGWTLVAVRRRDEVGRMKDEGGETSHPNTGTGVVDGPARSRFLSSFIPPPSSLRPLLLGGLMAGFAAGVKLTGVPLFLVAVPAAAFAVLARRSFRPAVGGAVAFGLAGAVAFAPWLFRTAAWSGGNPVFPEGSAVLGKAHFTDAQVERWKRAHAPQPEQQSAGARLAAFGGQVAGNWQFGYLLLPAGVVVMATAWRRRVEARVLALLLGAQAAFWLGMTHLQGRFFVPALPLAALAVALAPRDRSAVKSGSGGGGSRGWAARPVVPAALATLVVAAAAWGWWGVHARVTHAMAGLKNDAGLDARSAILASENVDWLEADLADVFPRSDPDAGLTLVGDAQVFWYTLPMSRLRYRTPFDVPQGADGSVVDGYAAGPADRGPKTWLRVAPAEVDRFVKTYQPFPGVPDALRRSAAWQGSPAWPGGAPPYVVPPGREP